MRDGCRLAARLWLPESANAAPVPAIIEYIPYRKRDGTRERDEAMHRYFAGHGYAALRIDLRGAGESDGILLDEYLEQEIDDGVAVIDWIAAQDWCDGGIGMIGKSWGGFNALQIAARRPAGLKAVISVCAADDRYTDDAHYMGGCLLNENLIWGSTLFAMNAQPPDPDIVGDRWRSTWLERLEATRLFPALWLQHPHRDDYWRHGSIREDYAAVECPVYAIGGWADGYSNAVPRLLANLRAPSKGLVGPWGHVYPHEGRPGPAIGFLQEALAWWGHWLRGEPTGLMEEPRYRVWMGEEVPASTGPVAGRWTAESTWPSPRIQTRTWYLRADGLGQRPGTARRRQIASPQDTGAHAGAWCVFGFQGELPTEQGEDDARSMCFDSPPLQQRIEILGTPVVELTLAADRPVAFVVVRLNEVLPNQRSERVSYGLLNLTHRDGHADPKPLIPGRDYTVTVALNDVAHAFRAGSRLRIAISSAYWPVVWPTPEPVTLSVLCGGSRLELPVRPASPEDAGLRAFAAPESAYTDSQVDLRVGETQRQATHDPVSGITRHSTRVDMTEAGRMALSRIEPIGLTVGSGMTENFTIHHADPLSARGTIRQRARFGRPGWDVLVTANVTMHCTADEFVVAADLKASENEETAFERRWLERVPRKLV